MALPASGFAPADLGVVANAADPTSLLVAEAYQSARGIPAANVVHVRFEPGRPEIPPEELAPLLAEVGRRLPDSVQGLALAWTLPFRSGCASITTAFAAGLDRAWCSRELCAPTRRSPYFDSASRRPYRDFGLRPAMLLAGKSPAEVRALVARGIAADGTRPPGTAYLVTSPDRTRNVRARAYPGLVRRLRDLVRLEIASGGFVRDRPDVLFYFVGAAQVPELGSNRFRPGALADHLTSGGGQLVGGSQMSALRWLEAGATASYGTVVEPCNRLEKFPDPEIAIRRYLRGESALEAYWKSVATPGEGVFVGEPLARPFAGADVRVDGRTLLVRTTALAPGRYDLLAAPERDGPYRRVATAIEVAGDRRPLRLPKGPERFYRLVPHAPPPGDGSGSGAAGAPSTTGTAAPR